MGQQLDPKRVSISVPSLQRLKVRVTDVSDALGFLLHLLDSGIKNEAENITNE